ncbi:hypothetical protein JOD57_001853 [Geodermatophilus bullaregiensis]|uniref:hypothetical protein n=1 Tax=Geodermatophilus bullaregiensis TaxID=1564160 RepID=UPI0019560144|nr:hypothetical protein [Geodermatophilus bullaregiensis]MBM7806016.1 hypothetical protein [Geodermatophilus bullaregiensis]
MTTAAVETVPAIWDDARDIPFFRITARLFTLEFCLRASLQLAGYDDTADAVQDTPAQHGRSGTTASAGGDRNTQAERDLIPVRVRRTR